MWSWEVETIKSSLILPNICLKHCFNLFPFEKVQVAQDEQCFNLFPFEKVQVAQDEQWTTIVSAV